MATPTIRIKRGTTTPGTGVLSAGELGMDLTNKNLFIGQNDGTPLAIGGEGTFATRAYAESLVDALGEVFEYVSTVDGGADAANATDLTLLTKKEVGDYYKVAVAGHFNDGTSTFYANLNDGLVWNTNGKIDIIDNTNSTVQGTSQEVSVTGSTDNGYTVALATEFKQRVSDVESKTQFISLADTVNPSPSGSGYPATTLNGELRVLGLGGGPELYIREEQIVHTGGEQFSLLAMGNVTVSANQEMGAPTLNLVSDAYSEDSTINITAQGNNGKTINLTAADINLNGTTTVNGDVILRGDGVNSAFSITSSGEVSIGAPGQDIYLDRPTYVTGDLSVTGNISATGTVSGTNITALENKTQNIVLADTTAGTTKITGDVVTDDSFIIATPNGDVIFSSTGIQHNPFSGGFEILSIGGDPVKLTGDYSSLSLHQIASLTAVQSIDLTAPIVNVNSNLLVSATGALTVDGTATFNNDATVVDKLQVQSIGWAEASAGTRVEVEGTTLKFTEESIADTAYGLNGILAQALVGDYTIATNAAVGNIVIDSNSGGKNINLTAATVNVSNALTVNGDISTTQNLSVSGNIYDAVIDCGVF